MKKQHLITASLLAFTAVGLTVYLRKRTAYKKKIKKLEEEVLESPTEYHHSIPEIIAANKEQQKNARHHRRHNSKNNYTDLSF